MFQTLDNNGNIVNPTGMLGNPSNQPVYKVDSLGKLSSHASELPAIDPSTFNPANFTYPTLTPSSSPQGNANGGISYTPVYVEPPPPPVQPKSGKIICSRYHELGMMSDELHVLDQAYGAQLMRTNPKWQKAYWRYARHIVKHLHRESRKSRLLLAILTPLVRVWSQEMGYRMGGDYQHSKAGSCLMWCMVHFFMSLGDLRTVRLKSTRLIRDKIHLLFNTKSSSYV